MTERHIAIKDWQRHQHYRDARPPWIKLYGSLLDDAAFLALPDAAQLQLIKLWLLASRMGHPLPDDARLLAGKIGCRGKFHLDALIRSGFMVYEKSREILDKSLLNVRPLSTENREQRTTPSPPGRPIEEQRLAERLPTDAGRLALDAVLKAANSRAGVISSIVAMLDGMHPPAVKPEHMDVALSDYVAQGLSAGRFNAQHFRSFTRTAARPERSAPVGGPGKRVHDKIMGAL